MKSAFKLATPLMLLLAASVNAQVQIESFSSIVNGVNTFYGTWASNGDTLTGSTAPNSGFVQGASAFDITGTVTVPTNSSTSKLELLYFSPFVNIGTDTLLAVSAQQLSGNSASSFKIYLTSFSNGGGTAIATFSTSSFPTGSYSTAYSTLTLGSGSFDPASVYSVVITGDVFLGTDAFKMSFDNLATAVPEPSTYAAFAGVAALAVAHLRRRRRRTESATSA